MEQIDAQRETIVPLFRAKLTPKYDAVVLGLICATTAQIHVILPSIPKLASSLATMRLPLLLAARTTVDTITLYSLFAMQSPTRSRAASDVPKVRRSTSAI